MSYQPSVVSIIINYVPKVMLCSDIDTQLRTQSFDSAVSLSVTNFRKRKENLIQVNRNTFLNYH